MPKGLERRYGQGHLHFITFSCYRRLPLLGTVRARNVFCKLLGEVRAKFGFALFGYVVMPEHVHLLINEPVGATPSKVIQVLKQRVSRQLRKRTRKRSPTAQLSLRFDGAGNLLPYFWQHRFYDFNVWSHKKRNEKLNYMHTNPVKRGLARHPWNRVWSSHCFYAQRGDVLLAMDRFG